MFPVHCPQKEKTGPGPVTEETMEEKAKRVGKFNVVDVIAVILILAVAALVVWCHRENIQRLLHGTEKKFKWHVNPTEGKEPPQ